MPSIAPLVPLAGAGAPWRSRRGWTIAISVLLHLLAVLALLGLHQRPALESPAGPAYDLVFDTPGAGTPAQPPSPLPPSTPAELARPEDALASPPAPSPVSPPAPDSPSPAEPETPAAPPPPLAAAPAPPAPSVPARQQAVPAASPAAIPAPPAMAFAPPPPLAEPAEPSDVQVVPTPTAPPEVRLDLPPPEAPQPIMPMAPPALPPPAPAAPRPRPPQPRAAPGSSLSAPMDLSFAPAAPPRAAPPPRGSLASRTIDLSLGAPKAGPNRAEAFFAGRAKAAGADWEEGLKAYWLRHRYYPRQAAESGEDGIVEIEMTVNRYGRVESVSVKSGSGSRFLDMAALGTWRNAQLPPLPAELKDDHLTLTIPIHYILIR